MSLFFFFFSVFMVCLFRSLGHKTCNNSLRPRMCAHGCHSFIIMQKQLLTYSALVPSFHLALYSANESCKTSLIPCNSLQLTIRKISSCEYNELIDKFYKLQCTSGNTRENSFSVNVNRSALGIPCEDQYETIWIPLIDECVATIHLQDVKR